MIPNLESLAAQGRRMHRSRCVIETVTQGPLDPDTGLHSETVVELYQGSCQVAPASGARVVEFGEGPTTLQVYDVELAGPVDGIPVEARVRFTVSPDPAVAGASGRVLEAIKSDTVTNRRLLVEVGS